MTTPRPPIPEGYNLYFTHAAETAPWWRAAALCMADLIPLAEEEIELWHSAAIRDPQGQLVWIHDSEGERTLRPNYVVISVTPDFANTIRQAVVDTAGREMDNHGWPLETCRPTLANLWHLVDILDNAIHASTRAPALTRAPIARG